MLPLLWVLACTKSDEVDRSTVVLEPSAPQAGVAETTIDLPVGSPMGGFSSRCSYIGGDGKPDRRTSDYVEGFSPTGGLQTRARAQVLWLEAGGQDLVLIRADLIYSVDELVNDLAARLEADTGRELTGHVVVSTSHTHNSYGNFSDQVAFYLGGDRFHPESYQRLLDTLEAAAISAHESLRPAAIGLGVQKDWDPDDLVYRDRRDQNDGLQLFDDIPAGEYKDPYLDVLRVDEAGGAPMGVFFFFGMHGTTLGEENSMISVDAPGHIEHALAERFDERIVVGHFQTAGGDASPTGSGDGYARLETIGEYAADTIHDLWSRTPTSSEPMTLEMVTQSTPVSADEIHVTRFGKVDWSYLPYEEGRVPDDKIWADDGKTLLSPFDEFNTEFGGAFCGSDDPLIPAGNIGTDQFPYTTCMDWGLVSRVLLGIFALDEEDVLLPTPHTMMAQATALRIGPLPVLESDGQQVTDDVLFAFFPGEPVSTYAEMFRRYAESELGYDREHAIPVGYSQDHEGYLLPAEDWMMGGYEPNITVWGPLFAEQILEHVIEMSAEHLTTEIVEPMDPFGVWAATTYPERPIPEFSVDATPEAGTIPEAVPEYLFTPWNAELEKVKTTYPLATEPAKVIPRVQGIAQLMWQGGDPAVDLPRVVLERLDGDQWVEVTTHSGRPVEDALPDIIVTHTPDPLYPTEATQVHTWWAVWQAVGHDRDRAGVPLGTYRLHAFGQRFSGNETAWPRTSEPYEVTSLAFEIVPATVTVEVTDKGVAAWIQAPAEGFRLVDLEGSSVGTNPLVDPVLSWEVEGKVVVDTVAATRSEGSSRFGVGIPAGATRAIVTDAFGNSGSLAL